jgi:CRP-like cAMP-binding protein
MPLAAASFRTDDSSQRLQQRSAGGAGLLGRLSGVASFTSRRRGQRISKPERGYECWHQIVHGAARQCVSRVDGQRQIIDFILPGDAFLQANAGEDFIIEATTNDTVVAAFPKRAVEQLAGSAGYLDSELRDLTAASAYRLQRQILILGRASAVGKLSSFLLDMADRLPDDGHGKFELPMSRYDIADHLVMSVETVSRSLTSLRGRGAIAFSGRRGITILDFMVLEDGETCLH